MITAVSTGDKRRGAGPDGPACGGGFPAPGPRKKCVDKAGTNPIISA